MIKYTKLYGFFVVLPPLPLPPMYMFDSSGAQDARAESVAHTHGHKEDRPRLDAYINMGTGREYTPDQ